MPKEHPLRRVKELVDAAVTQLSPLFDEMYSAIGRPSIPPERLLKVSLLMALYTVRWLPRAPESKTAASARTRRDPRDRSQTSEAHAR